MNKVKIFLQAKNKLLAFSFLILFYSCSSNNALDCKKLPDWYISYPSEPNNLFGIGEAVGYDLGLTRQDADANARDEIIKQIKTKITSSFTESEIIIKDKTQNSVIKIKRKQTASETIKNIKIIKRKILKIGNKYYVFSLAKFPLILLKKSD